jgi:phage terminase Nu1 subunit (DNA packaging protein)
VKEQHSIASLAPRLGLSRAATLGAIAGQKIPVLETITFGARKAYLIESSEIEKYRAGVLKKLEAKIAKLSADPIRRRELLGSALGAMRRELAAEQAVTTPPKFAEAHGISVEAASYLLAKYGRRVRDGFEVDAAALEKIKRHIAETRGGATIRNAGGPFVG